MRRASLVLMLAAALGVTIRPAAAQQDSVLVVAVRRATEGMGDSARAMVRARLRAIPPTDSLYAEALYTAGVVAGSSDSAMFYFRRVSVEFSQSSWADDALLRLGQLAFAAGDVASAQRAFERVLSDYPFSNVSPNAAYWLGRAHFETGDIAGGCRNLAEARDAAQQDIELSNQIAFYLQRCTGVAATGGAPPGAGTDTAKADTVSRRGRAGGGTFFAVQVAAVRAAAAADEVMRSLKAQGYTARVSRDPDGYLKVRVGHFPTKPEAERLAREIKRKVGGSPFVVEEQ